MFGDRHMRTVCHQQRKDLISFLLETHLTLLKEIQQVCLYWQRCVAVKLFVADSLTLRVLMTVSD